MFYPRGLPGTLRGGFVKWVGKAESFSPLARNLRVV
jgi:hypothetical protein